MNKNIALLKGLISIIKRHWRHFTAEDFYLLREIKYLLSGNVINHKSYIWDENEHPRDKRGRFIEKLTEAEKESLKLAAEGLSHEGIAKKRVTSPEASKANLKRCCKKLKALDRIDSTVQAIRFGFLDLKDINVDTDSGRQGVINYEIEKRTNELKEELRAAIRKDRSLKEHEYDLFQEVKEQAKREIYETKIPDELELEHIRYIACGFTNKDINKLIDKNSMAKVHIKNIMDKLAVKSRIGIVIKALKHKLVTIEEINKIRNLYHPITKGYDHELYCPSYPNPKEKIAVET